MKNKDDFHCACKGSHHMQPSNQHISMPAKINGTQRRTMVSPLRVHCVNWGMSKGTFQRTMKE